MCLKQLFSYSKWVLQMILFLTVFLVVQTLTSLFSLTVSNFVVFFKLLDKKFTENSKNMLLNCVSGSLNFDTDFLLDCTKFCSVFLGY